MVEAAEIFFVRWLLSMQIFFWVSLFIYSEDFSPFPSPLAGLATYLAITDI
jgi:hypothetical protein